MSRVYMKIIDDCEECPTNKAICFDSNKKCWHEHRNNNKNNNTANVLSGYCIYEQVEGVLPHCPLKKININDIPFEELEYYDNDYDELFEEEEE